MAGLREYQENSKKETRAKVIKAIENLKRSKTKITYKRVAEKAGVSESIIYKNEELVERIRQAKEIQKAQRNGETSVISRPMSSKDRKIQELEATLERYKEENKKLKNDNGKLLGKLELKTSEIVSLKLKLLKATREPIELVAKK